jgi:hypothetical protein
MVASLTIPADVAGSFIYFFIGKFERTRRPHIRGQRLGRTS